MIRLLSLALFIATWLLGSWIAGERMLPGPLTVAAALVVEARSGDLFLNLGATLARVALAFGLAMAIGGVIGVLMGRVALADRIGDPWLVVLLNLPALVIIVLAYIWGGLTEIAAILAVAVNKVPNAVVVIREGARALDPALDDVARVFAIGRWKVLRHVVIPQLAPYVAAAARSGLSLVWKIKDRRTARAAERCRIRDRCGVPPLDVTRILAMRSPSWPSSSSSKLLWCSP